MRSIKEADVRDKHVLVRVDFDVPLKNGKVVDDKRLRAALPTIEFLKKKKSKIILIAHLGRPKGKVVEKMSLEPVAKKLAKLLKTSVGFLPECIGSEIEDYILGEILLEGLADTWHIMGMLLTCALLLMINSQMKLWQKSVDTHMWSLTTY